MKQFKEKLIVGIDHGYGNIKTANHCFKTGIMGYDAEPLFTKDMLEYGGRYYLIGEGHKEFLPDKIKDEDYYLLTLVAIAEELKDKGLTEANVIIAAGLPLTWTSGQKNEFASYLSKNEVDYSPHNGQWKKETSCCRIEATTGGHLYGKKVYESRASDKHH